MRWRAVLATDFGGPVGGPKAGPVGGGSIPVPALWQLEGHGLPIYLANTYPPAIGRRRIPRIDQARNEAGVYGRTFEVPAAWAGRRISVVFEGVKAGLLLSFCATS